MSALTRERIVEEAKRVRRELDRLLTRDADLRDRLEQAAGQPYEPALRAFTELELQHVARCLTRAQATLVHRSDNRHAAALAILGYCDEADEAGAQDGFSVRVGP